FRALPIIVSPSAPPMAFSTVSPAERVRVSPALTTCAAGLPRLIVTGRVVVAEKSRGFGRAPGGATATLPRALAVARRKGGGRAVGKGVEWLPHSSVTGAPARPFKTLFRALPVSTSPSAPPVTFSTVSPAGRVRVSPALTTCAAGLPRLRITRRVVVAEKSR